MRRFFVLFSVVFLTACLPDKAQHEKEPLVFEKATVQIVSPQDDAIKAELTVEIADNDAKRMRGLMYRTELADDAGMLFLFPVRKRISMWMANTSLSLDMIFIDERGVVREIVENTVPFSHDEIRSKESVSGVLEVKAGVSERLNLQPGDRLEYSFFKLEKSE